MKKKHLFSSLVVSALITSGCASAGLAQVGLDFGGSSVSLGGIPGVDASPFPAADIVPAQVGGARPTALVGADGSATSIRTDAAPTLPGETLTTPPSLPTNQQAIRTGPFGAPSRAIQPEYARMNLMAPNSVDMSPVPSGAWHYGFPNGQTGVFQGVSRGSVGGFLPSVSTGSVDINTYDGPSGVPLTSGGAYGMGNINFSIPLGGQLSVGGSLNAQQAVNAVQGFFGQ